MNWITKKTDSKGNWITKKDTDTNTWITRKKDKKTKALNKILFNKVLNK